MTALAGERYARKDASVGGRRHGSNPGTVGLAGQRVPIRVPRIRHIAGSEIRRRSHESCLVPHSENTAAAPMPAMWTNALRDLRTVSKGKVLKTAIIAASVSGVAAALEIWIR